MADDCIGHQTDEAWICSTVVYEVLGLPDGDFVQYVTSLLERV